MKKYQKEFLGYLLMGIVACIATISGIWFIGAMLTPESSLKALGVFLVSVSIWVYLLKKL